MDAVQLPFNFRISELLPLARLLRASYLRDRADFLDLLPDDYQPLFLQDYDKFIQHTEQVIRSSVSIAQRQLITQRIHSLIAGLPLVLNRLEARARRAQGLTVPVRKLGIEAVRQHRNNDEHEGLADALHTLLQNIAANQAALLAKGQPQTETDQLQHLYDQLVADSTTQGSSLSNQRLLTAANVAIFRALYAPMQELMADGKSLYQGINPTKLKDYTLARLLKQVRRTHAEEANQ
jgi:hypothetical protein